MMKGIYWIGWRSVRSFLWLLFGHKPIDYQRVPNEGPVIVAANHQSYFDPPILGCAIKREMHFFAKKELFEVFFLGWLIRQYNSIPVRRGVYDPASLSRVSEILDKGGSLIVFPEGTRGDGKEFLKPKPGIGLIARRSRVPIVPAYIHGSDKLSRALFWRRRIKVLFGEPLTPDEIDRFEDNKEGYRSLAKCVMDRIGKLKSEASSTG
jgi:1-acyl-sn-glycerol-3-phosphate acyltransferase